ncbi:murein biosynthesis integral membrane protein MurJ [Candidatus Woesebacteria bacterium]|nr:murein biosynthesis integral membrane protein MurJ [Candidatus Woesebacteria bacterium]MCD8507669.1 murein biosynthesis integral membrane protein MurJ [Candidatus Woesebacteria bacterium]MCD8526748.1 murein biosynthesis integral membrane protein MurJ [Candidatus Woesebacteria bacterium]MCD8546509.1 murein biosynthesis integral membrane protein MurJ [Candidatus Woesebacteria bacterium]
MQAFTRWLRRQSSWIESQQASILSAATIIFVANMASTLAGLVKNRVLSSVYFTPEFQGGNLLDAYFVAFRAPDFAFNLIILGSLSAAFVPLFSARYAKSEKDAFRFANQTMYLLMSVFVLASIAILLFTEPFVHFLTGDGLTDLQVTEAISMTRIMVLAQLFFGFSGFISAMLQSVKRFIIPAFSPLFYNFGIIFMTVFAHDWLGIQAAAWGTVLGAGLHMAVQIPLLLKIGYRPFIWPEWNWADMREFFSLTAPRTLALGVSQLNLWVITFFATAIGGNALTMITFGQMLMNIPIRFFGVSIGQAALPFLSAEQHDIVGFRRTVYRSLRQIFFFAAPASVLLLILRVPAVRLAYGTQEFPWRNTLITAQAVGILAVSIAPQAATHLLMRAFYALNNTVTPLIAAVLYLVGTAAFGWYFSLQMGMGLNGIAWALTLAATLETFFLLFALIWRIGLGDVQKLFWSLLRITSAAFLMAVTLFVFQRLLDLYVFETSRTLQLLQLTMSVALMGGAVYLILCWLFRIEELTILGTITRKIRQSWKKVSKSTPAFLETISGSES